VIEGGMSHIYSFAVFSILIYLIAVNGFNTKWAYIKVALLATLIIIIRPINILFLIPVLMFYGIETGEQKQRLKLLLDKRMFM